MSSDQTHYQKSSDTRTVLSSRNVSTNGPLRVQPRLLERSVKTSNRWHWPSNVHSAPSAQSLTPMPTVSHCCGPPLCLWFFTERTVGTLPSARKL